MIGLKFFEYGGVMNFPILPSWTDRRFESFTKCRVGHGLDSPMDWIGLDWLRTWV